uniref:Fucolectin tachylectin-4 pentraxin-1 domain-containing protein n=1 Tax=Pelusios castaneus TaxID=367368 RepID=A0A8C8SK30_9SAUR
LPSSCPLIPAQNLALGREATQSSTQNNNVAWNAVDENRIGNLAEGTCSQTENNKEPWWRVDLGTRHSISAVIVKNREDRDWEKLKGAEIRVGNSLEDNGKKNPICGNIPDTSQGSVSTICCDGLQGRYVTIFIPGREEDLTLCEVEVIAQGCAPLLAGQNLALRREATQSSTDNNDVAGHAVDGNCNGHRPQGSCTHTQYDREPWWMVDLGTTHSISAVIVKNREDCCWERLSEADIHVGDSLEDNGKQNPICGTITDIRAGSVSTICCNGMQGRYVTISIPNREMYLTLCEVKVLGQSCAPLPGGKELAQLEQKLVPLCYTLFPSAP